MPTAACDANGKQEEKSGTLAHRLFVRQLTLATAGCFLNSSVAGNARQLMPGKFWRGLSSLQVVIRVSAVR
jgi:hypothetical protein